MAPVAVQAKLWWSTSNWLRTWMLAAAVDGHRLDSMPRQDGELPSGRQFAAAALIVALLATSLDTPPRCTAFVFRDDRARQPQAAAGSPGATPAISASK